MAIDFDDVREFSDIDVVISTLLPNVYLPDINWDRKIKLFLDANYRKSMLVEDFQRIKVKVVLGDRWLIHQAVATFKIFTGFEPPIELLNALFQRAIDYSDASVKTIELGSGCNLGNDKVDLIIVGDGLTPTEIKKIIDEEKCKAVNC